MIIGCIVTGLLFILSVILLTGHAGFLIAGYNTASPEEREKYDEKKLCRTMGVMLLGATFAVAGLLVIPYGSPYATGYMLFFFPFLLADIAGGVYYSNTHCNRYKRNYKAHGQNGIIDDEYLIKSKGNGAKKKKPLALIIGICVIALPAILLVSLTLYQANLPPVFTVSGGILNISCAFGENVSLSDIKSLELKDSLPGDLRKINGFDFGSILRGSFRANGSEAEVYMDASKPPFLYIETVDGLIILNGQSKAGTETLYHELKATASTAKAK